jgi:ankyrin repeat protein
MTEFESTLTAQGTEGCRRFLDSGISKYAHPELCVSRALIIALGQGHSSIAEILLERSTPEGELMAYEMWGVTPLHVAVALNDEAMVELLLMSNASPQRQLRPGLFRVIFMLNALGERSGVFDQLYHQYLSLPIPTPLGIAVENGNRSLVDALTRRYKNTYLLHALVWSKRDTWLRELLPDYLDNVNQPDETGSTPLHIAVMVKSAPCIDVLLSAHADGTLLNLDGLSPAHMAIEEQPDIGIFERLMESIDDANMAKLSRNLLTSVLNHASPSQELVIALLNRGASIDGIPARDWWRAFGPPEKDNDSHHIHISRSMNQTYSIHRCSNVNLNVLDLPAYFCKAHSEINMLCVPWPDPLLLMLILPLQAPS